MLLGGGGVTGGGGAGTGLALFDFLDRPKLRQYKGLLKDYFHVHK